MDRRVVRTIREIKESFIKLLHQQDFNKITVKMICDLANVERKTFYLHFKDKYDLLDVIIEDRIEAFRKHIKQMPNAKPDTFYEEALNFYDRHHEFLKKIYNGRGSVPIRKKIQNYVLNRFEEKYGKNNNPAVTHFISAGISGVFEAYVNGKLNENKHQIAEDVANLVIQARKYLE